MASSSKERGNLVLVIGPFIGRRIIEQRMLCFSDENWKFPTTSSSIVRIVSSEEANQTQACDNFWKSAFEMENWRRMKEACSSWTCDWGSGESASSSASSLLLTPIRRFCTQKSRGPEHTLRLFQSARLANSLLHLCGHIFCVLLRCVKNQIMGTEFLTSFDTEWSLSTVEISYQ